MAVKDEDLYHATQNLILATPRKYYPDKIHTSHWQLRSLISSPEQNIIYYPHGHEIICLNTKTRVREVISNITFRPRCLTASKDWVCCGGEGGQYSVIPLSGEVAEVRSASRAVGADARLPLDLDPTRRSRRSDSMNNLRTSRSRPISPNNSTIGSEIVNCITIWSPGEVRSEGSYDMPVAVVSNNDRSVSILDLRDSPDSEVMQKLILPDFVNRSVISPDGALLASVCDDPFLYIHERRLKSKVRKDKPNADYEWVLSGRFQLQGQRQSDTNELRGSFAVCFSKSGKYLAAATQYGIISIFEVAALKENASLPFVFSSSRPGPEPGAVRAMEFSPGPYDLLAWTESHGRFCVADVRNLFLSRQLVILDHEAEGMEKVVVLDQEIGQGSDVIGPRIRNSRNESRSSSSTPDLSSREAADARQIRQLARVIVDRYDPPPFSAEEIEVLHASQAARRQRDGAATREITSNSSMWSYGDEIPRSSMTSATAHSEATPRDYRSTPIRGLPPTLREFAASDSTASFRTFINERNREMERRNLRPQELSRRDSAILAAAEYALEREVAMRNENDAANSLERLTLLTQPRIVSSDSSNNPWGDIDVLYRPRLPVDLPLDRTTRLRVEIEDEQRGDFAQRLRQPWRTPLAEGIATIALTRREESPGPRSAVPGATMGCCWSQDGRVLYVGASEGIYEYHVNVEGRKIFPSLVLR